MQNMKRKALTRPPVSLEHSYYTPEHLALIKEQPHILGHIAGREKLTERHSQWIKHIWTGSRRPALIAHRGSFKSTAIGVIGSVWHLLFHPEDRIFIVRKTFQDACDTVSTIAKVMAQQEIRELFLYAHGEYPEFTMNREGKVSFTFKKSKTPEPSVMAFGINSPFTGRHADFILCDDISTLNDRLSKAEREYTKQVWMEISTNIIDRGKTCAYIGTPWHPDGVESLVLFNEDGKLRNGVLSCDVYQSGLISHNELMDIKASTIPSLFAANYELKFVAAEDAMFANPTWGKWNKELVTGVRCHVDAAYGAGDSNALTIIGNLPNGKLMAVGFEFSGHIKDWIDTIAERMAFYNARKIYVEKQSDRGMTAGLLRHAGLTVVEYDENTNKQNKIGAYLGEAWPRMIWADDTDKKYMVQITEWTSLTKEHDDCPDSASSLVRACFSVKGANSQRWQW